MRKALLILLFLFSLNASAQQPQLKILLGHSAWIDHFAVSPDEKFLATASVDNTVKIWDFRSKKEVLTLKSPKNKSFTQVAFSPDSKQIATGDEWGDILLWDVNTGVLIDSFTKFGWHVSSLAFSNNGKYLASTGRDSLVYAWEIKTGKLFSSIKLNDKGRKITFLPGDSLIAYSSWDGRLEIWNIKADSSMNNLGYKHGDINDFFITADGKYIVSVVETDTANVRIFDIENWKDKIRLHGHAKKPLAISTGNNDSTFYTFSRYYSPGKDSASLEIKKWDLNTALCLDSAIFNMGDDYHSTAVITKKTSSIVVQYNSTILSFFQSAPISFLQNLRGKGTLINNVEELANGKLMLFADDGPIKEYDIANNKYRILSQRVVKHNIPQAYLLKDKINAIISSHDNNLYNLNLQTFDKKIIISDSGKMRSFAVSKNEKIIAYYKTDIEGKTYKRSSEIVLKNLANDSLLGIKKFNTHLLIPYGLLQNNTSVVYQNKWDTLEIWNTNLKNSQPVFLADSAYKRSSIYNFHTIDSIHFLSLATNGKIFLWNWKTGKLEKWWKAHDELIYGVSFSQDSAVFLTYSNDKTIKLWNAKTFDLIKTLTGHESWVSKAGFLKNGTQLYSMGGDYTMRLWNIATGKEMASIVMVDTADLVTILPNKFYTATKQGSKYLSWSIANKLYPFEQFDLQYNRPQEVLKHLGNTDTLLINTYQNAYNKRLKRAGFKESDFSLELHLPEVELINEMAIPSVTSKEIIPISFTSFDNKYFLDRYYISVNNVPINGINGTSLKNIRKKSYTQTTAINLTEGTNKIQISCMNEKGTESLRKEIYITYNTVKKRKPRLYFVGIGVSKYKDKKMNLVYADKDTRDLAKLWKQKYPDCSIDTFINAAATVKNILAIKQKLKNTSVEDKVIISISGHGVLDKNVNYYLAMHDMDFNNPSAKGLSYEDLEGLLNDIPARKKLLLIDACNSGEVDRDDIVITQKKKIDQIISTEKTKGVIDEQIETPVQSSFELMKELFTDVSRSNGTIVISAAGGKQSALEDAKWGNGVFTYCFKKGLIDGLADTNGDGVTINELKNYVSISVEQLTNGRQKPTTRKENIEFDWKLW